MRVNMHFAKTNLSRLVEQAAAGEDVVIAKAGRPVARLVAYREGGRPRRPGQWKGKVRIAKDFDETPSWLLDAFKGGGDEPSA